MSDCLFCKICSGDVNTDFVYEDDVCVVFRDINPKDKTHLLVVPKEHIASIADIESGHCELLGGLLHSCKVVAGKLGLSGYKLQINVGKDGGQEIFHLHIHLLSKFDS